MSNIKATLLAGAIGPLATKMIENKVKGYVQLRVDSNGDYSVAATFFKAPSNDNFSVDVYNHYTTEEIVKLIELIETLITDKEKLKEIEDMAWDERFAATRPEGL